MKAFVPMSILLIALGPVIATGQTAAPGTDPAAPVLVHGKADGDGARRGHARPGGRDMHQRGSFAGAARRIGGLIDAFDTDGDGAITQDEVNAARTDRLNEFDADGDGALTLEEYQALWLDAMHERMVDRFQAHDDDGSGTVTVEEFLEDYSRIVDRADRNDDGKVSAEDFARPNRRGPATDDE